MPERQEQICIRGGIKIEEQAAESPDARVSGDKATWIAAFSPDGDRRALQFSGERELAEELLGRLAPQGGARTETRAA